MDFSLLGSNGYRPVYLSDYGHLVRESLCVCLGEGYTRHRAHDVALTWFHRALAIDPAHRGALAGAARAAELLGRHERALELYRRLLAVDPKHAASEAYLAEHDPSAAPEDPGPLIPHTAPAAKPTR